MSGYLIATFRIQREILYPKPKPIALRKTAIECIEPYEVGLSVDHVSPPLSSQPPRKAQESVTTSN